MHLMGGTEGLYGDTDGDTWLDKVVKKSTAARSEDLGSATHTHHTQQATEPRARKAILCPQMAEG